MLIIIVVISLAVMKDYHAALVDYNKAIELDSRFSDAYYNRGLTNVFWVIIVKEYKI